MCEQLPLEHMPKNRVEKLESTVRELESTVRGLTEELVETKERVRDLEAQLETEPPSRVPERRIGDSRADETPQADPDEVEAATSNTDDSFEFSAPDEADELEAPSSDTSPAEEKAEESRTDDIIVA